MGEHVGISPKNNFSLSKQKEIKSTIEVKSTVKRQKKTTVDTLTLSKYISDFSSTLYFHYPFSTSPPCKEKVALALDKKV